MSNYRIHWSSNVSILRNDAVPSTATSLKGLCVTSGLGHGYDSGVPSILLVEVLSV